MFGDHHLFCASDVNAVHQDGDDDDAVDDADDDVGNDVTTSPQREAVAARRRSAAGYVRLNSRHLQTVAEDIRYT